VGEHVQNKMAAGQSEGITSENQNSFAVLSNVHIAYLASKMGIHFDSLSFEKIDILKDLENARMKLNKHNSIVTELVMNMEDENLPLNEQNVLEWGTDDSEEEPYVLTASIRKSKPSKKYKRKTRASKNQPVDGSMHSKGGESKVSPRFNLRDRNTIKKVIK